MRRFGMSLSTTDNQMGFFLLSFSLSDDQPDINELRLRPRGSKKAIDYGEERILSRIRASYRWGY